MGPDAPKGRLVFVGLGLGDEDGLSIAGMKELEAADVVFAEAYTSTLRHGALQRLEARSGRKIELLDRAAVEDGARIMDESERKRVVLLVAGDPMAATTHAWVAPRRTAAAWRIMSSMVTGSVLS